MNALDLLIVDYKIKEKTIIDKLEKVGNDAVTTRLRTKARCYMIIIADLQRVKAKQLKVTGKCNKQNVNNRFSWRSFWYGWTASAVIGCCIMLIINGC